MQHDVNAKTSEVGCNRLSCLQLMSVDDDDDDDDDGRIAIVS